MQFIKSLFNEAWIGTLIGLISILTSFIISLYFYRKSQIGARPAYQMKSIGIINKETNQFLKGINISYKNKEIERLAKTYLFFWNDGEKTINGNDIVPSERIRVSFEEAEILSVEITKKTREVNNFTIELSSSNNGEAFINFDFLDPKDGAVIEFLHTGKKKYPKIKGVIKGIPKGIIDYGYVTEPTNLRIRPNSNIFRKISYKVIKISSFLNFIFALMLIILGLYFEKIPKQFTEIKPEREKWILIIMGIVIMSLASSFLFISNTNRRRYPKALVLDNQE
ncbi:MAG: hypothetical protein ACM3YE_02415 [Bacteroidota bacterium]